MKVLKNESTFKCKFRNKSTLKCKTKNEIVLFNVK